MLRTTTEQKFETAETILEQLRQSRINRFPFFSYTGIKNYTMTEDGELLLRKIPNNPGKIDAVWIRYDAGEDLYNITTQRNGVPLETIKGVFFDQMADIIVDRMGVR